MTLSLYGKVFGRLTVLYRCNDKNPKNRTYSWSCLCDCGNTTEVLGSKLVNGHTSSCGCLQYERFTQSCLTHGMRQSSEYGIWCGIKARCFNINNEAYNRYAGRGITMCDRWKDSFENFYTDMGSRPSEEHSIERLNNDGDYEPSNCSWATATDQANNRRSNLHYEHYGVTKTMAEWGRFYNISDAKLRKRLLLGWDFNKAVSTP